MKLDKLVKQLKRDATANPKKAALLALMAVVALYFWAPLAWRWVKPTSGKSKLVAKNVSLILTDDPAEATDKATSPTGSKFRWDRVRQLIASDSRTTSATFAATWTDPFATSVAMAEEPDTAAVAAAKAPPSIAPKEAGLVLTSLVIGPKKRTATINGQTYKENEIVVVGKEEKASDALSFRVVRISKKGVELSREDKTFLLELNKPTLATGDEIERTTNQRGNP